MRAYSCDVCDWTRPGALGDGWLTLTQHNDKDHGGDVTLHYCSTRCCEDDLDSLDLGDADTGHKPGAVNSKSCPECLAESHSQNDVEAQSHNPLNVSQAEKPPTNGHDPLCRWVDVADLARHDCDLCDLIARARADERDKPINAIPRAICNSEPYMWLMVGSNHPALQLDALRPAWTTLLDAGGGWGQIVRADERGES